ncbi:MAG: tetratricopeptide repeat protein, partial [Chloroflexota bacterium]|nr:tetratricopeptide repeat protein [Chloroflexota bacterium]
MIEPLLQAERLLLHGLVDQAEELYRRIAEQDPRNSIAVVGLARVAVERGEDEQALVHARAALALDPDNAAAIRLQARLTEVLAAGGAPMALRPAAASQPPEVPTLPAASAARPSEQVMFSRNKSMADHRVQADRVPAEQREQAEPATDA